MRFTGDADTYDRFMGRYSVRLAPSFADFAQIVSGQRVLDVGCCPGALTTGLVRRLEPAALAAVDPSERFVAAARQHRPELMYASQPRRSSLSPTTSSTRPWHSW